MTKMTYREQLADPRWQRKRLEVLTASDWACELCRRKDITLHVHHRRYFKGRMAWEYEGSELQTLCKDCHQESHDEQEHFERIVDQIPQEMLTGLRSVVVGAFIEYVCPSEWEYVDDSWARAGQLAWIAMNLNGSEIFEIHQCFQALGPQEFLALIRGATIKVPRVA